MSMAATSIGWRSRSASRLPLVVAAVAVTAAVRSVAAAVAPGATNAADAVPREGIHRRQLKTPRRHPPCGCLVRRQHSQWRRWPRPSAPVEPPPLRAGE